MQHESLIALANDDVAVEVTPIHGARVTSLRNRHDGREWLAPPRGSAPRAARYGELFTDTDHFGWDEMFPSVDACVFPVPPYEGAEVVDHGELWSSPWHVLEMTPSSVRQCVKSERFGYVFERNLSISGPTVRADYSCVVSAPIATPLLWALHPQFLMRTGSSVVLGGERTHVLDTTEARDVRAVEWRGDLVVERDVARGGDRMIYPMPGDPIDEARVVDADGSTLVLTWDRAFAPYLGIWMDHGRYTTGRVVALEPTNGFFDELARAVRSGTVGTFEPNARVTWWVELRVEQGDVA